MKRSESALCAPISAASTAKAATAALSFRICGPLKDGRRRAQGAPTRKRFPHSCTAGGVFSIILYRNDRVAIHMGDKHGGRLESEDATRRNCGLDAGFRVSADAFALAAHVERAEGA